MIKLLSALIMMFAFGTSTVNAEENATGIKDRISELADTKLDTQSIINAEVDKLSKDELKAIIENVNDLTEPTEDDLVVKETATNKLEEMKSVETSDLVPLRLGIVGLILTSSALIMLFMGYHDESRMPLIIGMLLIIVMQLLAK